MTTEHLYAVRIIYRKIKVQYYGYSTNSKLPDSNLCYKQAI